MDIKKLLEDAAVKLNRASEVNLAVRGGNSGVYNEHGETVADSPSQCLRMITLRAYGLSEPISLKTQLTFHVGFAWESLFEKLLRASDVVTDLQVQRPIKEGGPIPWTGTVDFTAKINGEDILFDTKSISSLNSYTDVFKDNKVKTSYVAQMVRYMYTLKIKKGFLVYASFIYVSKNNVTAGQYRKMGEKSAAPSIQAVSIIIENDLILVDGFEWKYDLADVLEHTLQAQNHLHNETVEPLRPISDGDFSPCFSCYFKPVCAKFEAIGSPDLKTFLKLAREN